MKNSENRRLVNRRCHVSASLLLTLAGSTSSAEFGGRDNQEHLGNRQTGEGIQCLDL